MGAERLYISHAGKLEGPISRTELERRFFGERDFEAVDYIWSESAQEWQFLAYYFEDRFPPPKDPPPGFVAKSIEDFQISKFSEKLGISNEAVWFLYREKNKFGPFRYLDLVKFIQERQCGTDDFVWKPGMSDWQRIQTTAEFSDAILRKLSHLRNFSVEKVFVERRFPRVPYDAEVVLHDDQNVIFGNVTSISEGGAFVSVQNPDRQKGDRLKIHFSPAGVNLPFHCIAEVTQVMKSDPEGYCIKFLYLADSDRNRIAKFAQQITATSPKSDK